MTAITITLETAPPQPVAITGGATASAVITSPAAIQIAQGVAAALAGLGDVTLVDVASGDVIQYLGGKWRNTPQSEITDGGNA